MGTSRVGAFPLSSGGGFGTIVAMASHRIRLTDEDLGLITAALMARTAMYGAYKKSYAARLIERLEECSPGNPDWLYGASAGGAAPARPESTPRP